LQKYALPNVQPKYAVTMKAAAATAGIVIACFFSISMFSFAKEGDTASQQRWNDLELIHPQYRQAVRSGAHHTDATSVEHKNFR
jgi:hypothetical protein